MNTYFNLRYEFDKNQVHTLINTHVEQKNAGYVCVADGVVLDNANRNSDYLNVVNSSMFSICDSSFVPLYISWIHGIRHEQYCGSQIFMNIVGEKKYKMFFMGSSQRILDGLKNNLVKLNPDIETMTFYELPFKSVEEFNYKDIAKIVNDDNVDIVWVALGAPKQEIFMNKLKPYLDKGVMIAVGAAFKFYSGTDIQRAPQWMVDTHLEFIYRILKEPRKQIRRCWGIISSLPILLWQEWRTKNNQII